MFADDHYVPILKGRAAEFDALAELSGGDRLHLTPLVEVIPLPWNFAEEGPATTVNEHISSAIRNFARSWGGDHRFFVDLGLLGGDDRAEDGRHPMALMLELAQREALIVVPVLGLTSDDDYRAAVRDGHDGHGACLRLRSADLTRVDSHDAISALVDELGLASGEVDLIVDLRQLNPEAADFNLIGAQGVLSAVPTATEWRSLTLAGSSFPENLTSMMPASEERFPRAEWAVWEALHARRNQLQRPPTFSDYAIAHPDPPESIDPRLLRVSAQLRYTVADAWLVFKERNIRDYGHEQFLDICGRLVQRPEFYGRDFSWGDAYIADRASGADVRPGNPRMWRKVGTSHHMAVVMDQIANLDA